LGSRLKFLGKILEMFFLEILKKIWTENRTENGLAIFGEGRFAQNLN